MKKILDLKLFGLVAILTVALFFIGVNFIEGQVKTQDKPDTPPGKDKKGDDDAFKDMPVCISLGPGEINEIGSKSLCDSTKGVTAFAGRRWGIGVSINKNTSNPSLSLTLGERLDEENGDPFPRSDDYEPNFDVSGRMSEPELWAGVGKECPNIKDMPLPPSSEEDPPNWILTEAELRFRDDNGNVYHLFWGPGLWPGDRPWTNDNPLLAPEVYIERNADKPTPVGDHRNWDVYTQAGEVVEGDGNPRAGKNTAFLWVRLAGWTWVYCGAYDVPFSFYAEEE